MSPRPTRFNGTVRGAVLLGTNSVHGYIFGDTKERFQDGELIHLSEVLEVWFDTPDGDILKTKNSVYQVVWAYDMRPTFSSGVKFNQPRKKAKLK